MAKVLCSANVLLYMFTDYNEHNIFEFKGE